MQTKKNKKEIAATMIYSALQKRSYANLLLEEAEVLFAQAKAMLEEEE
jgi:hypothetical protein